jgi:hypothetical protein
MESSLLPKVEVAMRVHRVGPTDGASTNPSIENQPKIERNEGSNKHSAYTIHIQNTTRTTTTTTLILYDDNGLWFWTFGGDDGGEDGVCGAIVDSDDTTGLII